MDWLLIIFAFTSGYIAGRVHAWVMAENAFEAKVKADEDDTYYDSLSEIGEDRK